MSESPQARALASEREFLRTHPWMNFVVDLNALSFKFWRHMGEARSKCLHLADTPMEPSAAAHLHTVYLAKGVHATTAIEGNTLTEEQVSAVVDGKLSMPPSKKYLQQEVENIIVACNQLANEIHQADASGLPFRFTPQRIKDLNRLVLKELEVDAGVVPGETRAHSVVVARYRGAPAQDCDFLLELLCDWLNGDYMAISESSEDHFLAAFLRAALGHLYFAWIHPFGDGNGRTARLIEFAILVAAGLPSSAAHLLSNHYNQTRDMYYRRLDQASREYRTDGVAAFLAYAAEGFVDQLVEQLTFIEHQVLEVAWRDFVHRSFSGEHTPAKVRARELALALPSGFDEDAWVTRTDLVKLTVELAALYSGRGRKTLTRDINRLSEMGLIRYDAGRNLYASNRRIMFGLMPRRVDPDVSPIGEVLSMDLTTS